MLKVIIIILLLIYWTNYCNKLNESFNSSQQNVNIPIYYINLDSEIIRNKAMIQQFQDYNISNYTRISAVDGKQLTNYQYNNDFNELSNGQIACTLSHLNTIYEAYQRGLPYILVLEDDILLDISKLWGFTLLDLINDVNNIKWDISRLYSFNQCNDIIGSFRDIKYSKCTTDILNSTKCWSTAAYIINYQGMKKIIDRSFTNNIPTISRNNSLIGTADEYLYNTLDDIICLKPSILHTNLNYKSSIIGSGQELDYIYGSNPTLAYWKK